MRRPLLFAVALACLAILPTSIASAQPGRAVMRTFGTNSRVYAVGERKGVAYVGGQFLDLVKPGQRKVRRPSLAAISLKTGQPTGWHPRVRGGPVYALKIHRNVLYIGGGFTSVMGKTRRHLAAINLATGHLLPFKPRVSDVVWSLATNGKVVWAGGAFTTADGQTHERIAAFHAAKGRLVSTFQASADSTVKAVSYMHGSLYVGGFFSTLDGSSEYHIGRVDGSSGAVQPFVSHPSTNSAPDVMANNGHLLFVGFDGIGGPTFHGIQTFSPRGALRWSRHTCGDVQGLAIEGPDVYIGGHFHCIDTPKRRYPRKRLGALGAKAGRVLGWHPVTNIGCRKGCLGVWAMSGTHSGGVTLGGDFTRVDGTVQRRFAYLPPR